MDLNTVFVIALATTKMIMPGMPDMSNLPGGMGMPGMGAPQMSLTMDLTSEKAASKSSKAECAIPAGLKLGPKVNLVIDLPGEEMDIPALPGEEGEYETPEFKIKYYWMCAETVPAGQPRVLDTEKMMEETPGMKAQMEKAMKNARDTMEEGSYAYWPDGENPIKDKSHHAPGAYKLTTNYCGGTDITLDKPQDFLAPIDLTSPGKKIDLTKTIQVEWKAVPNALAYILSAFGSKDKEMIIWTSSGDPNITADYASQLVTPDEVKKLIEKGILLPPTKTSCRIPAGIFKDCQAPMLSVTAIGTDKVQNKDGITTKVTVRSTATVMLAGGMDFGDEEAYMEEDMEEDVEEADADVQEDETVAEDPGDSEDSDDSEEAADDTEDAIGAAEKAKDTVERVKNIFKW